MQKATRKKLDFDLIQACFELDLPKIQRLLDEGADVHALSDRNETTMSLAIRAFSVVSYNFLYDSRGKRTQMSFSEARAKTMERVHSAVSLLLERGYNINFRGPGDATALYYAIDLSFEMVNFLIKHGADPNGISFDLPCNESLVTPLDHIQEDMGVYDGETDVMLRKMKDLLLSHGAKHYRELKRKNESSHI